MSEASRSFLVTSAAGSQGYRKFLQPSVIEGWSDGMQGEQGIIRASGRDRVVRGVYCGCARVACLLCTVPRCPRTEADAHKEVLLSKRERGGGDQGNAQFTGNSVNFNPNLQFSHFCRNLCSRDVSCDRGWVGPQDTVSLASDCTGRQLLLLQNPPLPGSAEGKPGRQCCHYLVVSVLQRRGWGV